MAFFINSPRGSWYAHNSDIKQLFGLRREDKWPSHGLPSIEVAGRNATSPVAITVFLLPRSIAQELKPSSRRARRCFAICPDCSRAVCAGHTHQHVCSEV